MFMTFMIFIMTILVIDANKVVSDAILFHCYTTCWKCMLSNF